MVRQQIGAIENGDGADISEEGGLSSLGPAQLRGLEDGIQLIRKDLWTKLGGDLLFNNKLLGASGNFGCHRKL